MLALFAIVVMQQARLAHRNDADASGMAAVNSEVEWSRIRASTFQMTVIISRGNGVQGICGLASLVNEGPKQFILTHNHWGFSAQDLVGVELRNEANGSRLLLDGATFRSLICYRDKGTMILEAPEPLLSIVPAALGDTARATVGDMVWLAANNPGSAGATRLVAARIEAIDREKAPGRVLLRVPEQAGVTLGDSGGGVWFNGKLIGNLWSIVAAQADEVGPYGSQLRLSNVVFAALQPLCSPVDGIRDFPQHSESAKSVRAIEQFNH
jgi:hypothetical protein